MRTAAVVTVSDSCFRGEQTDRSGPATSEVLRQHGFEVTHHEIVPDEQGMIEAALLRLSELVQLVVTTGGTGLAERDVTPEATRAVCARLIDGVAEAMRAAGVRDTARAILSRGLCGTRGSALLLNLPGAPGGAVESLEAVIDVLPHALDLLAGKTEHE